jgi:uncharacterized coiled-coil DUF342 family protein
LSERKKTEIVADLNEKLSALKDQENRLETEASERAEKRDKLNGRMRSLRDEVLELRGQRDELNSRVKELKQHRNEMTARVHERLEETKKLEEEKRALAKRKPAKSHEALQKEVDNIDWTIQTTSLTLQEDRELVEKVKQLETQLAIHKKLEQVTKRVAQIRTEIKGMKSESELLHKQLTEEVQKERKESQDALRETLEKQAKEKLKRGEKLSWEEFQLLAEKGMTDQN